MQGGTARRLLEFVLRASPAAFRAIDELCALLESADPTSPVVIALRIACEARKATRRRRRRA